MSELSVEDMFVSRSYEASTAISASSLTGADKRRFITHAIAEITQKILSQPNANPAGLAITVSLIPSETKLGPQLYVLATCPQYEFSESFFS